MKEEIQEVVEMQLWKMKKQIAERLPEIKTYEDFVELLELYLVFAGKEVEKYNKRVKNNKENGRKWMKK